jgi:short-subunit dehydrogenase
MYGKNVSDQKNKSWAVITGGSDGIGLSMSKNLAL